MGKTVLHVRQHCTPAGSCVNHSNHVVPVFGTALAIYIEEKGEEKAWERLKVSGRHAYK